MNSIKEKVVDNLTAFMNRKVYVSRRDVKDAVERFTHTISIVSIFFFFGAGLYYYNESIARNIVQYEMDIKLIDLDIKRDNSMRLYYDEKVAQGDVLTPADHSHLKRIRQRLERNYARIEILNENLDQLR
jgi:hypothetical protein